MQLFHEPVTCVFCALTFTSCFKFSFNWFYKFLITTRMGITLQQNTHNTFQDAFDVCPHNNCISFHILPIKLNLRNVCFIKVSQLIPLLLVNWATFLKAAEIIHIWIQTFIPKIALHWVPYLILYSQTKINKLTRETLKTQEWAQFKMDTHLWKICLLFYVQSFLPRLLLLSHVAPHTFVMMRGEAVRSLQICSYWILKWRSNWM